MTESRELLAQYAKTGSEAAFGELVKRYINLVYSTALRLVAHDTQEAEDVTQTVFIDLARLSRTLSSDTMLGGWLHQHTFHVASTAARSDRRRRAREREAVEMNTLHSEAGPSDSTPLLDEAITQLPSEDRTAILLRFFEQRDFRSVGEALGTSEDSARMRVNRAVDKLHGLLKQRGVTLSAAALGTALGTEVVTAAPAGLAPTISAAALSGTAITTTAVIAGTKAIAMTTIQKTLIAAAFAVAVGTGIYEARQAAGARAEVQTLQQQQTTFTEQIQQFQREHDDLTNRLALLSDANQRQNPTAELLKLRSQAGMLREQLANSSNAKAHSEQPPLSSAQEYLQRSYTHYINHDYEAQLDDLNRAIEMDPKLAEAYSQRGNLYSQNLSKSLGGYEKAVADWSRCLELKPNDCAPRHNRALGYEQLRQYDNAIADYTTLIEGDTDFSHVGSKDKQLALAYHYRGRAYQWYKKDYAKAVADYNQALRLDPNIEGVHLHRGQCYEALGQPDKAQADFAIEKPN